MNVKHIEKQMNHIIGKQVIVDSDTQRAPLCIGIIKAISIVTLENGLMCFQYHVQSEYGMFYCRSHELDLDVAAFDI